jgi:hypothetical protein
MSQDDLGRAMTTSITECCVGSMDAIVLAAWLDARLAILEESYGISPSQMPELPSQMSGFNCILWRADAVAAALRGMAA